MTEEEYFRKTYPDFCYGDKLLSPYWDLFQYGVEFGERQSEKKIEELEQELAVEKDLLQEETKLHLHAEEYNKSLEKENAGLKEELTKKADTNHSLVEQMADLESKNAELKEDLEIQKKTVVEMVMPALDRTIKQRTQAEELIKSSIILLTKSRTALDTKTYLMKAKQFLQEIEK